MWQTVRRILGYTLIIIGLSLHIPLIASLQEQTLSRAFLIPILVSLIIGGFLYYRHDHTTAPVPDTRCLCVATVSAWIVAIIVSAIPLLFYLTEHQMPVVDALFEATSGLTTTGATILTDLETVPRSILLWRATMQFIGGLGFIMIVIALAQNPSTAPMQFLRTEYSGKDAKTLSKTSELASRILILYTALTCTVAVGYYWMGLSFIEALCHAMSTISTGGFSTHNTSIGYYQSHSVEILCVVFMFLSAMPLLYLYSLFSFQHRFYREPQIKVYCALVLLCILMLFLKEVMHQPQQNQALLSTLTQNTFTVVTIITSTGFDNGHAFPWKHSQVLLLFLMFIGGCHGSTAGGIKISRFIIAVRSIQCMLHKTLKPDLLEEVVYGNKTLPRHVPTLAVVFLILFFGTFASFAIVLSFTGLDFASSLGASISALSNIGPSVGEILNPSFTYQELHRSTKATLIVAMLAGRLELVTLAVVVLQKKT